MTIQISRSEQKRRMKQLEKLVAELSSLPSSLIDKLPCNEEIRSLFHEAGSMKGGTRNRQVKYITKQLKNEPVDELYSFLTQRKGADLQDKKSFQEVEYLRDSLLNEAIEHYRVASQDQEEMDEDWPSIVADKIFEEYPAIERKLLTRLAWLYTRTRNRKHSRELFRIIRSAQERAQFLKSNK